MDLTGIGPWLFAVLAVPALVAGCVAALALRGTRPDQRAGILHALADFARALLLRGGPPRALPSERIERPPSADPPP